MTCRTCKIKMLEEKRSFHKQRKWICPRCGKARMQTQKPRRAKVHAGVKGYE